MPMDNIIIYENYHPIKDINFTSGHDKKRKLDRAINGDDVEMESEISVEKHGDVPTEVEMDLLFASVSLGSTQAAVFSLLLHYSEQFILKFSLPNFPKLLLSLKQLGYIDLGYEELLTLCGSTVLEVTAEISEAVERETRSQSHSRLWLTYRAGRVTTSKMKLVCHANPGNPSQSLIKTICYPAFTVSRLHGS